VTAEIELEAPEVGASEPEEIVEPVVPVRRRRVDRLYTCLVSGLGLLFFCTAGLLAVVIVRGEQREDAYQEMRREIRERGSSWRDSNSGDYEVLFSYRDEDFISCQDALMTVRDGVPTSLDPACMSLRDTSSYSYFPWAAGSMEQLYTWLETQPEYDDTEIHSIAYDADQGYITRLVLSPYESSPEITVQYRDLRPLE
jgi:hypothetical protein